MYLTIHCPESFPRFSNYRSAAAATYQSGCISCIPSWFRNSKKLGRFFGQRRPSFIYQCLMHATHHDLCINHLKNQPSLSVGWIISVFFTVCVFGGPLLESCTGGLVYSHDLQTCDWPRLVVGWSITIILDLRLIQVNGGLVYSHDL